MIKKTLFGLFDYEEYILRKLVKSDAAKNLGAMILMLTTTTIIRFHISIVLSWLTDFGTVSYFCMPVLINIMLSLMSNTIYLWIDTYKPYYLRLSDYFITHYSSANLMLWKRIILVAICCYIFLCLSIVTIDNTYILVSTIQYCISFGICDLIEQLKGESFEFGTPLQRYIYYYWDKFLDWKYNRASVHANVTLHNDYVVVDPPDPVAPAPVDEWVKSFEPSPVETVVPTLRSRIAHIPAPTKEVLCDFMEGAALVA